MMRTTTSQVESAAAGAEQRSRRPALVAAGLAGLAALAPLAGCGDDDSGLEPDTYEVVATDFAFGDVPEEVAAGSTLTLTNESDVELHELVAIRLPDDEERSASEIMELSMGELMAFTSGLTGVTVAPPGEDGMVVEGTGELAEPGRYLLLCAIPTGVDPGEYMAAAQQSEGGPPEIEGAGPPHFVHGMWTEVTVVDAS